MAPKELEKVLYFAASIVTWIDEEAREKDIGKLEKEVNKVLDGYKAEREQRIQELSESLERRVAYIGSGEKPGQVLRRGPPLGRGHRLGQEARTRSDREARGKEMRKELDAEIADTEAYLDDAVERMEEVWKLFQEMKVKDVINDEAALPRAQGPLRLPVRLGRVLPRRHGRGVGPRPARAGRPRGRVRGARGDRSTPRRARSRPARSSASRSPRRS